MNDDAIREDVLYELKWDSSITCSDIAVTVKEAVVALSGFVPNYWKKLEAEKAVKRVRGVRGVANDISIARSSKRTDPEVARSAVHELENHVGIPRTVSPAEVKDKIEEALRRSAELDAGRIVVEVVGATVKLEGAVRSWAERSEAERAAWSAPGTANVENHLSIKPY
jgi:osmotically-inducible protein OsmY